jgi:hypothetical protein
MAPEGTGPDEEVHAEEPPHADEGTRADQSDADLLQGLSALADLFSNASHTLNQCLLTIEDKLSSMVIAQAEWVPIQTARSVVERVPPADEPVDDRQQSQERMFGGVPVIIMRMSMPGNDSPAAGRCEWQYELGYSVVGDEWALLIRTATFGPSKQSDGGFTYSDLMLLREAPLEIRLKAIREIPILIRLLAEGAPQASDEPVCESVEGDPVSVDEANAVELTPSADVAEEVTRQLSLFA